MENTKIVLPNSPADIARLIYADWQKVNYAAAPWLSAMADLRSIDDQYGQDSARSIIRYFLCNAGTWKGPKARTLKAHLNKLVNQ